MPHPNRSKNRSEKSNPTTTQIARARDRAGLTQAEAAKVIHGTERAWQDYEGGQRNMHPGLFELFRIKTGEEKRYPTAEETISGLGESPPSPAQHAYAREEGAIGKKGPIRFKFVEGLACPFFVCDVCGEPLTEAGWTMIVWDMSKEKTGDYELYPVHKRSSSKRRCIVELEQRIERSGGSAGSIELREFLRQLAHNSGFESPALDSRPSVPGR